MPQPVSPEPANISRADGNATGAIADAGAPEAPHLAHEVFTRTPWVTGAIAVLCVAIFIMSKYWGNGLDSVALWRMGANSGEAVRTHGEWWRLLASTFLHGDVMHLISNMVALLTFGPLLEKLLGAPRYTVLYVLAALGGSLASAWLSRAGMSVGASGAIWGLMTAGLALALWPRGLLPPAVLANARRQAMFPLALNIFYSFQPGIDLHAHFGGGAVGFALMATGLLTHGRARDALATRASAGLALLAVASLGWALWTGKPWGLRAEPMLTPIHLAEAALTLAVPADLVAAKEIEVQDHATIISFGTLARAPFAVEVVTAPTETAFEADDVPLLLEASRASLELSSPAKMRRVGTIDAETIAGWPYLRAHYTLGKDVIVETWFTYIRDQNVVVRTYAPQGLPAPWAAAKAALWQQLRPDVAPMVRPAVTEVPPAFWQGCERSPPAGNEPGRLVCGSVLLFYKAPAQPGQVLSASEREAALSQAIGSLRDGFSATSVTPLMLAAPQSTARAATLRERDKPQAAAAAIFAMGSQGAEVTCLDERPAAATPSCADLTTHLLMQPFPSGK